MSMYRLMLVCVLAILLANPDVVVSRMETVSGVRFVSMAEQALVLEVTVALPDVESVVVAGGVYDRLVIADAGQTMTPGAPQVPLLGAMVGLGSTAGVTLQIVELDTEVRRGTRLAPAPQVSLSDAVAEVDDSALLQERVIADPVYYATDAFYPASAAELGDIGMMRDQAVAQVRFLPIQYNPVSGEVYVHRRIRVRVSWDADPGLAATPSATPAAYEDLLRTALVNYAHLDRPPLVSPDPSNGSIERGMAPALAETRLKILVDAAGFYKITANDLNQAGMDLSSIDPRTLRLSQGGQEIAMLVSGQEDGRFDPADYLLFYGVGLDTRYTGTNVYWLTAGTIAGQRIATRHAPPGNARTPEYFPTRVHAEQNTDYWQAMPDGADQDHWFWGARLNASESRSYTVRLNGIADSAGQATVRVGLKGFSDRRDVSPDHRTRIYLNGTWIDSQRWDGQALFEHRVQVAHSLLRNGDNRIRVESVGMPDPEYPAELLSPDQIWVNWIEIEHQAEFVAAEDELVFTPPQAGTFQFQVANFRTDAISLFDISDPTQVVQISGAAIAADGDRFMLRFQDTATLSTRYLAQATSRYKAPLALEVDQASNWRNTSNRADYIIITHHDFLDAAQRLAEHHRAAGMQVALVDIADLYDEFTHGIFDPAAIRAFLAYAYQHWQSPAPTYVLLMGDAYWDYRDYEQTGTPNYVPVQMVQTAILGDTPSDNWFVAVSGTDILPDMLVGRIAVQTPQQARAVVDKIIAYDQTPPADPWNRRALLVADDDDANFEVYAEAVAQRLPDTFTVDRVYIAQYPPGNPTRDITEAINQGTLLVHYAGHGIASGWGAWGTEERIFDSEPDVSDLENNGQLPVVVVANCLNGFFAGATHEMSLAEEFQRQENRGAIAVWAATAVGYPSGHAVLMGHFYDAIFTDAQRGLGAATTQAKIKTYAESNFWGDLVKMYVLFGDPATKIGVLPEDLPITAPTVVLTEPATGVSGVALDAEIRVVFSQPMNPDTLVVSGMDDLVLTSSWNDSYTAVTYAHTGFAPNQTRTVHISGQSEPGLSLPQTYSWSFRTIAATDGAETVAISGPETGQIGQEYTFNARISPLTARLPMTYSWEASEQTPVVHNEQDSSSDAVAFTWATPGVKVITVTATNADGTSRQSFGIQIDATATDVPKALVFVPLVVR